MKKGIKTTGMILFVLLAASFFAGNASAVTPVADETALFTNSTSPDALIILDLSASMNWNPAGGSNVWGNASCSGTGTDFYISSGTGHTTNCSRLNIAKRAIFDLLDDNDDNTINSSDEGSLGVRIGYMRFKDCNGSSEESAGVGTYSYETGCNQIAGSGTSRRYIGSKYSQIFCNSNSSCSVAATPPGVYSTGSNAVGGEIITSVTDFTPLAAALREAKLYLEAHKAADTAGTCRQKFAILITDGSDTMACFDSSEECVNHRYKNRRESVAKAKALADAGYKVFVIGFGSAMPPYLQNTLHWMAYYGKTDNPNVSNSGDATTYAITLGCNTATPSACCTDANPAACYPSGVTGCATDSSSISETTCYDNTHPYPGTGITASNFQASSNDPGYLTLSGYAFLASNADQLATSLKAAMDIIRQANFSFSQSSIQSARTEDENFIYEGSFEPKDGEPFWIGHLKKYQINPDGTVGAKLLDAGEVLKAQTTPRVIKTYKSGALMSFTTANIFDADLGVGTSTTACGTTCANIVGFIYGGDTAYATTELYYGWRLGDVFRSTPITVGTPSAFFEDGRDSNNRFAAHRSSHVRTSLLGNRLIVAGANGGQFHAFKTFDLTEAWSFVPPNLLTKLKLISHTTHNATAPVTSQYHNYFVDGPVSVADVWLGDGDGTSKTADWKTLLVFAEGRGATNYAWSSSSSCESGTDSSGVSKINGIYTTTYKYYCGYYAFNLHDSLNPAYMWHIDFADDTARAAKAPYLGDPWSKMMAGRVRIKVGGVEKEKWVGFIGAGYNAADCSGGGTCSAKAGKGFFVIDLSNGQVLWSYTMADNSDFVYSMPASPSIVDTDNDGFIDTAYVGDLGGNMWRFKFCLSTDASCGISGETTNWSGGKFYASSSGNIRPIFTMPAVAKDNSGNLWVYWGTGDKMAPTASNAQERLFAVKDNRTSTYGFNDLNNITSDSQVFDPASTDKVGYAMNLSGSGQKVLADPTVFGGVVYFTSYNPPSGNDPCEQGGVASLHGLNATTGAGALTTTTTSTAGVVTTTATRSITIGSGIPTAPIISMPPGSGAAGLYVTTSGGGGTEASTNKVDFTPAGAANRTNMLYWRDMRLQ